ncbi:MAG: hypothetical protein FJ137_10415 [Deltaproteobacteria bacterium]|nr:hypothetical protein [Deltaproteobacteria bacterium]
MSLRPRATGSVVVVVGLASFVCVAACPPPPSDDTVGAEADRDGDGYARPGQCACCDPERLCASDCHDDDPESNPSSGSTPLADGPGDGLDKNCDDGDALVGVDN